MQLSLELFRPSGYIQIEGWRLMLSAGFQRCAGPAMSVASTDSMFTSTAFVGVVLDATTPRLCSSSELGIPFSSRKGSKCAFSSLFLSTRRLQGLYSRTLRPPNTRKVAHIAPPTCCHYRVSLVRLINSPTISQASPSFSTPSQNLPWGSATLSTRLRNCTVPIIVATMTVMTVSTML
jgi:hypothetical protein